MCFNTFFYLKIENVIKNELFNSAMEELTENGLTENGRIVYKILVKYMFEDEYGRISPYNFIIKEIDRQIFLHGLDPIDAIIIHKNIHQRFHNAT